MLHQIYAYIEAEEELSKRVNNGNRQKLIEWKAIYFIWLSLGPTTTTIKKRHKTKRKFRISRVHIANNFIFPSFEIRLVCRMRKYVHWNRCYVIEGKIREKEKKVCIFVVDATKKKTNPSVKIAVHLKIMNDINRQSPQLNIPARIWMWKLILSRGSFRNRTVYIFGEWVRARERKRLQFFETQISERSTTATYTYLCYKDADRGVWRVRIIFIWLLCIKMNEQRITK